MIIIPAIIILVNVLNFLHPRIRNRQDLKYICVFLLIYIHSDKFIYIHVYIYTHIQTHTHIYIYTYTLEVGEMAQWLQYRQLSQRTQHPQGSSQPSVTPVPGDPMPPSGF